jgi:hypothetical protein
MYGAAALGRVCAGRLPGKPPPSAPPSIAAIPALAAALRAEALAEKDDDGALEGELDSLAIACLLLGLAEVDAAVFPPGDEELLAASDEEEALVDEVPSAADPAAASLPPSVAGAPSEDAVGLQLGSSCVCCCSSSWVLSAAELDSGAVDCGGVPTVLGGASSEVAEAGVSGDVGESGAGVDAADDLHTRAQTHKGVAWMMDVSTWMARLDHCGLTAVRSAMEHVEWPAFVVA